MLIWVLERFCSAPDLPPSCCISGRYSAFAANDWSMPTFLLIRHRWPRCLSSSVLSRLHISMSKPDDLHETRCIGISIILTCSRISYPTTKRDPDPWPNLFQPRLNKPVQPAKRPSVRPRLAHHKDPGHCTKLSPSPAHEPNDIERHRNPAAGPVHIQARICPAHMPAHAANHQDPWRI